MLPSHGGNFKPLDNILDELNDAVKEECKVVAYTNLIELVKTWEKVVDEESGLADRVGGHADIAESSLMLLLHPELVREEKAEKGFTAELDKEVIKRSLMKDSTPLRTTVFWETPGECLKRLVKSVYPLWQMSLLIISGMPKRMD